MNPNSEQPPTPGSEPPPLPPPIGRRTRRIWMIIVLAIPLALGMAVGAWYLAREIADRRPGAAIVLRFDLGQVAAEERNELWQGTLKAINLRAAQLGGCRAREIEPGRIRVKFPGRKAAEIAPAAAVLTRRGRLEFRLIHPGFANLPDRPPAAVVPSGHEVMVVTEQSTGGVRQKSYYAVRREPEQTGADLAEAYPVMDPYGAYQIFIRFTAAGGRHFAEVTGANVGRLLGIVLDGRLYSAPRINERIAGGSAQITGKFTQREAIELASILNSPLSLPATFTLENEDGTAATSGTATEGPAP